MPNPIIRLSQFQIDFADKVARHRQENADRNNRTTRNNGPSHGPEALQNHTLGSRCEAVAKLYLNPISWNAYGDLKQPDLDGWIDVRGRSQSWHDLIVQRDDRDHLAFLLVRLLQHPEYEIVAWCYGWEAKRKEFWSDPAGGRAAHFIPADASCMKSPEELRREVRRRQNV